MIDFSRHAAAVAPDLLGSVLTVASLSGSVSVLLTEVEAYGGAGEDPASHAFRGLTRRTATMFAEPGHLYVYFTYGMHHCVNVVTSPSGTAGAVLLRAGRLVAGTEAACARRFGAAEPTPRQLADIVRGPGRLAQALGLALPDDGTIIDPSGDALSERSHGARGAPVRVTLVPPDARPAFRAGPRVGITTATEVPWRFWIDSDPSITRYRPGVRKHRRSEAGG